MTTDTPAARLAKAAEKLRTLAGAATPGPWTADTHTRGDCVVWGADGRFVGNVEAEKHWVPNPDGSKRAVMFDADRGDVELIAALHPGVALLIAEVFDTYAYRLQHPIVLALAKMGGKSSLRDAAENEHNAVLALADAILEDR